MIFIQKHLIPNYVGSSYMVLMLLTIYQSLDHQVLCQQIFLPQINYLDIIYYQQYQQMKLQRFYNQRRKNYKDIYQIGQYPIYSYFSMINFHDLKVDQSLLLNIIYLSYNYYEIYTSYSCLNIYRLIVWYLLYIIHSIDSRPNYIIQIQNLNYFFCERKSMPQYNITLNNSFQINIHSHFQILVAILNHNKNKNLNKILVSEFQEIILQKKSIIVIPLMNMFIKFNIYNISIIMKFKNQKIIQDEKEDQESLEYRKSILKDYTRIGKGKKSNRLNQKNMINQFNLQLQNNLKEIDQKNVIEQIPKYEEMLVIKQVETKKSQEDLLFSNNKNNQQNDDQIIVNKQVRKFLEAYFPDYKQQNCSIKFNQFLSIALKYFLSQQKITNQQFNILRKKSKKLLTTTNEQIISLNALNVLTKDSSLRYNLLEIYLKVKYDIKIKNKEKEQQKIFEQLIRVQQQISLEKEQIQKKYKQLKQRENLLYQKQKQTIQRQKDLKSLILKQYGKYQEKFVKLIADKNIEVDKKTNLIQRNLKYKIQILDKRIEQYNQVKILQKNNQQKHKQKIIKLDKQNDLLKYKIKELDKIVDNLVNEKEKLLIKLNNLQEKCIKQQKKILNLKQEIKQKDKLEQIRIQNENKQKQEKIIAQLNKNPSRQLHKQLKEQIKIKQETKKVNKKQKQKEKDKQEKQSIIQFISTIFNTLNNTLINIIQFYKNGQELIHFTVAEVFYPKHKQIIQLFQQSYSHLNYQSENCLQDMMVILKFIKDLIIFSYNYDNAKSMNEILPKYFSNNQKLQLYQKKKNEFTDKDPKIYQKHIKFIKKYKKSKLFQPENLAQLHIIEFIYCINQQAIQQSLKSLNKLFTQHQQCIQYLLKMDFLAFFIEKITVFITNKSIMITFIDMLLQMSSTLYLNRFLELLQQFQNYKFFIKLFSTHINNKDIIQKVSIILQRYSYRYKKQMEITSQELNTIKFILKQNLNDKQTLIRPNLQSIINDST